MLLTRIRWAGLGALLFVAGCGARSGLHEPLLDGGVEDAPADVQDVQCITDQDCATADKCSPSICVEGACMPGVPVDCNDHDPCTKDSCEPSTGQCQHKSLTLDQDGDGHKGPRPGYAPGAPGSCGDDCDDTNPNAYPGGTEICDGVDNDCNGIIDDNMSYVPAGQGDVRVSGTSQQSGTGGLAYNGKVYAATYGSQNTYWLNYFKGLSATGKTVLPEIAIAKALDNYVFAGPIVWTGAMFGTAWEDARTGNYDIYFNRLDKDGKKLGPDERLTASTGYSLGPNLIWNGTEFLVAWYLQLSGQPRIYGRRIDVDGKPIGGKIELTNPVWFAESPKLAEGVKKLGLAFNMGDATSQQVGFRLLDPDMSPSSGLIKLSTDSGTAPTVVWNGDRYVVVYSKWNYNNKPAVPGDSIWGASVDENGKVVTPEKRLTTGAKHARAVDLLALGNRLLLIWADDKDGNYELYSKMLNADLTQLSPRRRITNNPADTLDPIAAFGPSGDVGVLFDDNRSGSWQTYFTRLVCKAGATP